MLKPAEPVQSAWNPAAQRVDVLAGLVANINGEFMPLFSLKIPKSRRDFENLAQAFIDSERLQWS